MKVEETRLEDCFIITSKVFKDSRGYFYESFNERLFKENTGLDISFVQDNESMSSRGVLRGLHFQIGDFQQAKLVRVIKGSVLDVCVDIRKKSPTFGEHFSIVLSEKNKKQLFVPRGFAHGFVVLEDETIFNYKCDNYYSKASESGIIYNDKDLSIDWQLPHSELILSEKDKDLKTFQNYCNEN